MKKIIALILAFSCFTVVSGESWAADSCGVNNMKLSGVQHIYDDEFLYDNKATYDNVVDKNGVYTDLPGKVYECDNEWCNNNDEVFLKAGHVFEGEVINEDRMYTCSSPGWGDDKWVVKIGGHNCGEMHMSGDGLQEPDDNEFLYSTHAAYLEAKTNWGNDSVVLTSGEVFECDNDHCGKGTVRDMPKNHSFNGVEVKEAVTYECKTNRWVRVGAESCLILSTKVASGEWYTDSFGTKVPVNYNACHQFMDGNKEDKNAMFYAKCERVDGVLKNVCYKIGDANDDKKPDDKDDNDVQKCVDSRKTEEGKACCYLPESVAKFKNGKCVCSGGKTFRIDMNGRGMCTGGNNGDDDAKIIPVVECQSLFASVLSSVQTKCVNLRSNVEMYMQMCTNGLLTYDAFYEFKADINTKCLEEERNSNIVSKQKLVDAADKLETMIAGFEKSRWKSAEGKFNTARLASDSIAGVVLGTTGGLITSSVMKKKQTEQGFEDLQCVVGGQPVAGWGDEFMVGIQ